MAPFFLLRPSMIIVPVLARLGELDCIGFAEVKHRSFINALSLSASGPRIRKGSSVCKRKTSCKEVLLTHQ